jgi:hypothetical protein
MRGIPDIKRPGLWRPSKIEFKSLDVAGLRGMDTT